MVGAEGVLEIRVFHRHGKGIREIARDTGISRNTGAALSARQGGDPV
jgi:hypothetical protein